MRVDMEDFDTIYIKNSSSSTTSNLLSKMLLVNLNKWHFNYWT